MEAGMHLVTRARGYRVLEYPQIQQVLARPPTACVTQMSTNEAVELFDGGWLSINDGMPHVRVIVARHHAPSSGKRISVGKCIGEWIYELFITTLPVNGFLVEEVLDLYHGQGNRARRSSAVRRLLPSPSSVERYPHLLEAIQWVDGAGRSL